MGTTLLEVRNLSKTFRYRTGLFRPHELEAVKPVSFMLRERQTLAIIGENGSGKSTLAKMISGMIKPTSGDITIDDHKLEFGDYGYRSQHIRMIFQDPNTSFNPRQRIGQLLDIPLKLNTDLEASEREKQINLTLRQVGLLPDHAYYYPQMLASGQKQRVALARALILQPKIIVADVIEQVGKQLDVTLIIGKSAEILNTVFLEQLDDALIIVIHSDDVLS